MKKSVKSAKGQMKLLFIKYRSILRTNCIKWVTAKTPEEANRHILTTIAPVQLITRLEQDLQFSHADFMADFDGFVAYILNVFQAFEKVGSGLKRSCKSEKESDVPKLPKGGPGLSPKKVGLKFKAQFKGDRKGKKPPPMPCTLPKRRGKDRFRWLFEFQRPVEDEKRAFREEVATPKAPARPTCLTASQTGNAAGAPKSVSRLQKIYWDTNDSSSCHMTVSGVMSSLDVVGQCDDSTDENITKLDVVDKAVIQDVVSIQSISKMRLKVALKKNDDSTECTFSRAWNVPSTVLHLSIGRLALKNITNLIANKKSRV